MDHLRLQSAFKFVAISIFGDGGQLMTAANLCLEAVRSTQLTWYLSELYKVSRDKWRMSLSDRHLCYSHAKITDSCTPFLISCFACHTLWILQISEDMKSPGRHFCH